jgi:hypothetical protein
VSIDIERVKQFAPFGLPLVLVVGGWLFLISPRASENAREAQALDGLQQRLTQVRASLAEPPPPPISGEPREAFERQVAARDVSLQVIQQLARLAAGATVANLSIDTGDQVTVSGAGPRVSDGGAPPDPRFALFDTPLAYSPITMSFDADFDRIGEFLWAMRDLATTIEIRSLEITPRAREGSAGGSAGPVHVALTLFAYVRQSAAVATAGVSR